MKNFADGKFFCWISWMEEGKLIEFLIPLLLRRSLQSSADISIFNVLRLKSVLGSLNIFFCFCNFVIRRRADNKEVKSFIQLCATTLIPSKIPLLQMNEMKSQKLLNFIKLGRTFRLEVFRRPPAINWLRSFIKQRGYNISTRKVEKVYNSNSNFYHYFTARIPHNGLLRNLKGGEMKNKK